jgi:hypothetical protein
VIAKQPCPWLSIGRQRVPVSIRIVVLFPDRLMKQQPARS